MKLFIWNDPYPVELGSSMVFAVAKNLEAAKKLACSQAAKWFTYGQYEEDQREWTYPL